jgi:hypothetical protein
VTFPGAFHQGYNTGANVFEARNFASPGWPQWAGNKLGKYCRQCREALLHEKLDNILKVCVYALRCDRSLFL